MSDDERTQPGSRRSASPNGVPADYPGRRDVAQPGTTPARRQDRSDPLTDPRYAQRPPSGRTGYGGGNAGYAPDQHGSEGPGQGADAYPNAYPGAGPGPRGDRYQRDGHYQPDYSYPRETRNQRDDGYQNDRRYQDGSPYQPDGYQDDRRNQDGDPYQSGDRYQSGALSRGADPSRSDSRNQRDDRTAEPGRYRGRRRNNGPAPEDYAGFTEGAAHYAEGPGGLPWSDSRGTRNTLGGPGAPDEHAGKNADDYAGKNANDYEDDRFVPGLGGPRYRDEDGEVYEDDGYDNGGGGDGRRERSGRGPNRRRSRWIAPLIAVAVILTPVVIGGVYAFNLYQSKYHPADYATGGTGQAIVQVQTGQTATAVGERLVTLGVVASVRAFELAAEHSTNSRGLEPGFYRVHKQMKASLAFALLLNPSARVQIKITIPEGWRLSQILAALGARSGIPLADYQKAVSDPAPLGLPSYSGGMAEGYLFPATYEVQPNQTATTVLQAMVQRFDQEAASTNLPQAAASVHMTPSQVIIVASLIQAEGGSTSYYPQIARVIYNRLAQNMALQLDSTVMYGLNTFGIIASDQQLQSASRYNTYKYKGLPPGPIDSPGSAAIEAALHPASGHDLYFVTVNPKTGLTEFTVSPVTFEQLRNELERNLGQG